MGAWRTPLLLGVLSASAMAGCGQSKGAPQGPGVCEPDAGRAQAATIYVSRSTNSPEIFVAVFCDGRAERTLGEAGANNSLGVAAKSYDPGSPEVLMFLADLDAVGDVSAIPASHAPVNLPPPGCAKSVSFGTLTTIESQGKTSGDVQCIENATPAQTALVDDCRVLAPWP